MNPDLEWQRRYEVNDTPWDKGMAAPPLREFLRRSAITGRILIPGCGRGHDARFLARQSGASVTGLDLSPLAVRQATELNAGLAGNETPEFIEGDFFNLPSELQHSFDWVVEHTCFCAIEPRQRLDYIQGAANALKSDGKIFAIFYLNPDVENGPPFRVSQQELADLFGHTFLLQEEWQPQESFPGREGRELVQILQKR